MHILLFYFLKSKKGLYDFRFIWVRLQQIKFPGEQKTTQNTLILAQIAVVQDTKLVQWRKENLSSFSVTSNQSGLSPLTSPLNKVFLSTAHWMFFLFVFDAPIHPQRLWLAQFIQPFMRLTPFWIANKIRDVGGYSESGFRQLAVTRTQQQRTEYYVRGKK